MVHAYQSEKKLTIDAAFYLHLEIAGFYRAISLIAAVETHTVIQRRFLIFSHTYN
jgi:hypothetical protein